MSEWNTGECIATSGTRCSLEGKRPGTKTSTRNVVYESRNGGAECGDLSKTEDCEADCTPPSINNECYNTEIDNCSQDYCEVKSKLISSKCYHNQKCRDLSTEDECNIDGCSYLTNVSSNCEGKEEGDCDSNICVWNGNG